MNSGLLPVSSRGSGVRLALFYGGIVQVAAGLWEFVKGNTFGSTAFCSYGAFWMAFWYLVVHVDLSEAGADATAMESGSSCSAGPFSRST